MKWDGQQDTALAQVARWMLIPPTVEQLFCLFGYAGVGKTTLAKYLVSLARRKWLFASFTGKAAHVLRTKGCEGAQTIHSLIYRPAGTTKDKEIRQLEEKILEIDRKIDELGGDNLTREESQEAFDGYAELLRQRQLLLEGIRRVQSESEVRWALWANSPLADPSVEGIVIDECSMVDKQIGQDLESFGKKILVLGDPAQLPPVGGGGYFTNREPDVLLTEVHRHAQESGILRLATQVRQGANHIGPMIWGEDCSVLSQDFLSDKERQNAMLSADQVLVGRNATRRQFNLAIRHLLGYEKLLVPGDRLVCLKNDRALGVYNGSQWKVQTIEEIDALEKTATVTLRSEDNSSEFITVPIWLHHLLGKPNELSDMGWDRYDRGEFDYGYVLTVHKAQGSQWDNVVLCDEGSAFRQDARRWRYTGITRAARKLTVLL